MMLCVRHVPIKMRGRPSIKLEPGWGFGQSALALAGWSPFDRLRKATFWCESLKRRQSVSNLLHLTGRHSGVEGGSFLGADPIKSQGAAADLGTEGGLCCERSWTA